MMLALFVPLALAQPAPTRSVGLAVLTEEPSSKQLSKLIRQSLKRAPTLVSGKDWGRVVCFVFEGPIDRAALERSILKSGLQGEVREGVTCDEPPTDAFFDAEPVAWLGVRFPDTVDAATAQAALVPLLPLELGLVSVKVSPAVAGRACLELSRAPDLEAVGFALQSTGLEILGVRPAMSCVDALTGEAPDASSP